MLVVRAARRTAGETAMDALLRGRRREMRLWLARRAAGAVRRHFANDGSRVRFFTQVLRRLRRADAVRGDSAGAAWRGR
jgi:hypothetical protein